MPVYKNKMCLFVHRLHENCKAVGETYKWITLLERRHTLFPFFYRCMFFQRTRTIVSICICRNAPFKYPTLSLCTWHTFPNTTLFCSRNVSLQGSCLLLSSVKNLILVDGFSCQVYFVASSRKLAYVAFKEVLCR